MFTAIDNTYNLINKKIDALLMCCKYEGTPNNFHTYATEEHSKLIQDVSFHSKNFIHYKEFSPRNSIISFRMVWTLSTDTLLEPFVEDVLKWNTSQWI